MSNHFQNLLAFRRDSLGSQDKVGRGNSSLDFSDLNVHGRDEEMKVLGKCFDKVKAERRQEVVLCHGHSGSGKTRLIMTFKMRTKVDGGAFFVSGKFDQMKETSKPYAAIVTACTDLCEEILNSADSEDIVRDIDDVLGDDDTKALSKVIPAFQKLLRLGTLRSELDEIQKPSSIDRIIQLLRDFIQAVSSPTHPVIMFIDDLQFADPNSLEVFSALACDPRIRNFMLIGAYRDNEIDHNSTLTEKLVEISDNRAYTDMPLSDLEFDAVNMLIAEVVSLKPEQTESLAAIVYQKTQGNCLFVLQFLGLIQEEGYLYYSAEASRWEWELDAIIRETTDAENVVEILVDRIQKLPPMMQDVLKNAACLGCEFSLDLLAAVIHSSSNSLSKFEILEVIPKCVSVLCRIGMLQNTGQPMFFCFTHDRIQQVAYSLVTEGLERQKLHLRIGMMMIRIFESSVEKPEWMFFMAVDQMNLGRDLIEEPSERMELATLNSRAAAMARAKSAFFPAARFASFGVSMLDPKTKWDSDLYDFTLELCSTQAEMSACSGDVEQCKTTIEEIIEHSRKLNDKLRAQVTLIQLLGGLGDLKGAVDVGFRALDLLGITFNRNPTHKSVAYELLKTRKMLWNLSEDDILNLPKSADEFMILAGKIITIVAWHLSAIPGGDRNLPLMMYLRMMQMSIKNGLSMYSPYCFAAYAANLSLSGQIDKSYKFGELSLRMNDMLNIDETTAGLILSVHATVGHWKSPFSNNLETLLHGYNMGMKTGNVEFALTDALLYCIQFYFAGLNLSQLSRDMRRFADQMLEYRQDLLFCHLSVILQQVYNLRGFSSDSTRLCGSVVDYNMVIQRAQQLRGVSAFATRAIRNAQLELAYFFGSHGVAECELKELGKTTDSIIKSHFAYVREVFISGLVYIALARERNSSKWKRRSRKNLGIMKSWASQGAVNCQHMLLLMQADYASLSSRTKYTDVTRKFSEAIAMAEDGGYIHDEAIACERAAEFQSSRHGRASAVSLISRAFDLYSEWGATAKLEQLQRENMFLRERATAGSASTNSTNRSSAGRYATKQGLKHRKLPLVEPTKDFPNVN